ncbi:hypothetical protein [Nocardioides ungokensis]|uniref:ammonium transporter n=1 Tax=Nocardioides ungokensis TaxID=1643322 RepID=UPI0031B630F3
MAAQPGRPGRLRGRHRGRDLLGRLRARPRAGPGPPGRLRQGPDAAAQPDPRDARGRAAGFGWFGFNAGSALGADQAAAVVFTTTLVAGAAGTLGWLVVERLRDGHATSLGAASGMVAGLVAITPSCGSLSPLGAMVMGAVAGAVCAGAVGLKYRFGYDDSLDVVGVHLVGGLVGTFGIGILATAAAPTGVDGLLYGGGVDQLGRQVLGGGVVLVYAFVVSGMIGVVVDRLMGFRIDEEHEVSGIDLVVHAETAYDLHATAGARSAGHGILGAITQQREEPRP